MPRAPTLTPADIARQKIKLASVAGYAIGTLTILEILFRDQLAAHQIAGIRKAIADLRAISDHAAP